MPTKNIDLELAPIGNGRMAALVDAASRIVWWCSPRIDGDPIFCRLIAGKEEKGFCDVLLTNSTEIKASYIRNTAILETICTDKDGNSIRIVDFFPRFPRFERIFHPPQMFRRIEPLSGVPRVTIRIRPTFAYGNRPGSTTIGSNHIRYCYGDAALRVTTDAPLSYLVEEAPFALVQPVTLVFGGDEPFEASPDQAGREFLERTHAYWVDWVRSLGVPLEWQSEVIRAAISLKLCSFDETGAVVAALTTSIPEAPNSERTWDYRYCWLRDAYFVIKALNQLGATHTMESYLNYITNISTDSESGYRPVYGVVHAQALIEKTAPLLHGYGGAQPVRIGNQAMDQVQHDAYGSIILGASQMFIDERLPRKGDVALFNRLEPLGEQAKRYYSHPDAGPWELRGRRRLHTYSATMCWVACDRLAQIATHLGLADRASYWALHANRMREEILTRAWNESRGSFVAAFDDEDLDAITLLLPELGIIQASDPRFIKTVKLIGRELLSNGFMRRYTAPDDFGSPEVAFIACQFWYIDALSQIGEQDEARALFEQLLLCRNQFGILSEDIDPTTRKLWGNLPQTYSMAGLINSAIRLSKRWGSVWSADGTRSAS